MQVMHTYKGIERCVYIPIQAKDNYPTMVYLTDIQRVTPSMLRQVYLPAQILKATE